MFFRILEKLLFKYIQVLELNKKFYYKIKNEFIFNSTGDKMYAKIISSYLYLFMGYLTVFFP